MALVSLQRILDDAAEPTGWPSDMRGNRAARCAALPRPGAATRGGEAPKREALG
jgi:hypothetical protein